MAGSFFFQDVVHGVELCAKAFPIAGLQAERMRQEQDLLRQIKKSLGGTS